MFLSLLLLFTLSANAVAPRFTILGESHCVPFEGVLFDKQATAEILSGCDIAMYACDIKVQYELNKLQEHHKLELESLKIEHTALTAEYNLFLTQKDKEIQALVKSLKKTSPRNKTWWFIGGIVAGSAATYGAYRAFDER
jgi:hypothetical protein|tara:strand:- start:5 stop:424 length:420 start_codon:yes stop_codon:yes gene_type:complete